MKKSLLLPLLFAGNLLAQTDPVKIQTVFVGLDNTVPINANVICRNAAGKDGLVLTVSHQVDGSTLQPTAIRVYKANGDSATPQCALLAPANESNENRSILMFGEFGNDASNPPVRLKIVGDIFTKASLPTDFATCAPVQNLRGLSSNNIIQLLAGPVIAFAQRQDTTQMQLGQPQTIGVGAGCPVGTKMVIQVAWSGGIVSATSENDSLLYKYYTVYADSAGTTVKRFPYKVADLNDNDNYHDLCMNSLLKPIRVEFVAGKVQDPNGDKNPLTARDLTYCSTATGFKKLTGPGEEILWGHPQLVDITNPSKSTVVAKPQ